MKRLIFFGKNDLLLFQLINAFFEGANDGFVLRFNNLVERIVNLLFDTLDLAFPSRLIFENPLRGMSAARRFGNAH